MHDRCNKSARNTSLKRGTPFVVQHDSGQTPNVCHFYTDYTSTVYLLGWMNYIIIFLISAPTLLVTRHFLGEVVYTVSGKVLGYWGDFLSSDPRGGWDSRTVDRRWVRLLEREGGREQNRHFLLFDKLKTLIFPKPLLIRIRGSNSLSWCYFKFCTRYNIPNTTVPYHS